MMNVWSVSFFWQIRSPIPRRLYYAFVVVAELVAANSGLDYQILLAQRYLKTESDFCDYDNSRNCSRCLSHLDL